MPRIGTLERGTRLGPYEIGDALGSGGMGEVFRARDTRLDRSVAIKVLPHEFAANAQLKLRFEREARTISQLNHPHICTLHDVGSDRGVDYLVMELCDGESLADRLLRGPLPLDQALRIGIQIADALDRAHRSEIVHRDLKPGNVMITKSGAKLLDFGLAKTRESSSITSAGIEHTARKALTQEGTIVGTFQYMAPEQLEGAEADARSDIFAFGALLYEMISGRRAFDGKTRASVIASILEREPVPLSQLHPVTPYALERIVKSCLEKAPEDRWQNAHDLKQELQWLLDRKEREEETAQQGRARMPLVAALVLLPLLAAGGTFFAVRGMTPSPRRLVSTISAPRGTQFIVTGDAAGPVTLSPDGHLAAFVATNTNGSELWLQSLDSGSATRVPGGAHAMFPFWSPDSRSVAFFANGRLMAIDVDGSVPHEIADAPDARGGMWTADGQIIFAPQTQSGLFRVAANGGKATRITFPKAPFSTHRWPALLPDGRHMIYLAAMHGSPADPDTSVFISSLDGKESRKLLATSSSAIPYRDWLLYVRGERLVAQRMKNGQLAGEVIPLLDRVLTDPGTWRSVFSVSSDGLLATYPSVGRSSSMRLLWIDRSGKELGEAAAPAIYRDVALSPDGQKLAMTIGDPNSILYVEDLRRGVRSRLSSLDAVAMPLWTGDGRSLIFNHVLPTGSFEILIKAADGSTRERSLVTSPYPMQPTAVDMVRGLVLFNTIAAGAGDIQAVPLAGGSPITIAGGSGQQINGVISPDGRWLAYVEVDGSGRAAYVTTYPTLGPKWQVSDDTAYWMWWNAKGDELHYLTGDGQVKTVSVTFENNAVQFSAPKDPIRVHINTNRRGLSITPDGSRLIAATLTNEDPGPATLVTNFDQKLH